MNFPPLKRIYLFGYRIVGFAGLMGVAAMLVIYTLAFGFFLLNTTWVAPSVVEPTSEKVLPIQSEMIRVRQFMSELSIGQETKKSELQNLAAQKQSLLALRDRLNTAILAEQKEKRAEATTSRSLLRDKHDDIARMSHLVTEVDNLTKQAKAELDSGLITKSEYSQRIIGFATLLNQQTDNKLSEASVQSTTNERQRVADTLSGKSSDVSSLDAEAKKIEIQTRLADIDVLIAQKTKEIEQSKPQLEILTNAFNALNQTPYGDLKDGKIFIAFVPYDNHDVIQPDAPVYSCFAVFVGCRKVGKLVKEYKNEQIIEFPLLNLRFSRSVRGTFVKLELDDPIAAEKQVLFVGSKPLFF